MSDAGVVSVVLAVTVLAVLVPVLLARKASGITADVAGQSLRVGLGGKDAFFALRRTIELPLTAITGAVVQPSGDVPRRGLRLPGTEVPGVIRAGSYGRGEAREFWLVRRADEVLVIDVAPGHAYRRLVLELPDPSVAADRLQREIAETP